MRLKDRAVIVTGAAKGLGRSYALRIAQEGGMVAVTDVLDCSETAAAVEAAGGQALPLHVDVADEAQTSEMARQVHQRFGRIDGLVNNAGIMHETGPRAIMDVDIGLWDRVMAVNAKGPFLCIRAVFPYMKEQRYGKIVNCSSGTWLHTSRRADESWPTYVVSKAGVAALTRAVCRELGAYNITVNTLAPGTTDSYLTPDQEPPADPRRALGRRGRPEDLTGPLVFLLSPDSDFMTGQMVLVNGGLETV